MLWTNLGLGRTLNYLRVRHDRWREYNIDLPLASTAAIIFLLSTRSGSIDFLSERGIIAKFAQYFTVLAPFYLAALAAVATFSGPDHFNKEISPPAILNMRGKLGVKEPHRITARHFLSLLFGYCCVASMALFLFAIIVPFIYGGPLGAALDWRTEYVIGTAFFYLFSHVMVTSLFGIYYLADRLHRNF